ncbi:MAG: glycosyltransferase family 4 protein [Phycisphaerales bacterium]
MTRRLLLVAYYFPPIGGAGAQRPAKFVKHLPAHDWEVQVVAPHRSAGSGPWAPFDRSLVPEVGNASVHRASVAASEADWRPRIDGLQRWAAGAWTVARRLLERERFDAVLITMSPFSLGHLALSIKKSIQIPVIVDLRDPWAIDGWPTYRSQLEWRRHRSFMREVLTAVDGVIANTPTAMRRLQTETPQLAPERWEVIPNGFDPEDFAGPSRRPETPCDRFVIVHTGSLHSTELYPPSGVVAAAKRRMRYRAEPILPEGRTLRFLLEAIRQLRDTGHPAGANASVRCIGVTDAATQRSVDESGVSNQVELLGYRPHDDSVRELMRANLLFLPLHGYADPRRRSLIVPGKTYEYLASGRPILACLPPGDAYDLVARSGRGFFANPTDSASIRDAIALAYDSRDTAETSSLRCGDWLGEFERSSLTGRLAAFLERTAVHHSGRAVASCS